MNKTITVMLNMLFSQKPQHISHKYFGSWFHEFPVNLGEWSNFFKQRSLSHSFKDDWIGQGSFLYSRTDCFSTYPFHCSHPSIPPASSLILLSLQVPHRIYSYLKVNNKSFVITRGRDGSAANCKHPILPRLELSGARV